MTSSASATRTDPIGEPTLQAAFEAARARTSNERFVLIQLPVTPGDAEALVDLDRETAVTYWAEPAGYEYVGLGALRTLSGSGPERFREISSGAQALFTELGSAAPRVRLFGGFAFQPRRAAGPEWVSFGEARFVLPRVAYERRGDTAHLSLLLTADEVASPGAAEAGLQLAERVRVALHAASGSEAVSLERASLEERPDADFLQLVDNINAAITRGEFEKIVLARRVTLALQKPPLASRIERRLADIAPECLRFAFRAGPNTFLGATPERLVSKSGRSFETEAVAGTIPMGEIPPGRLMESAKNRAEQAIVVRELLRAFEPIAATLDHTPTPEIHRLRHLAHLRTRIRGQLREPLHVLDLVERLHPTPAVGGVPSAAALAWIAEHEPDERGWYAGPIGWMDHQGDGAFAVALRSGLLQRDRATLYAGAGIVQGSDAKSELAETRWKLKPLLGAFGVVP
ncbi:MAG: isochorismate synthase [Myxococcota bacterium]